MSADDIKTLKLQLPISVLSHILVLSIYVYLILFRIKHDFIIRAFLSSLPQSGGITKEHVAVL